MKKPNFTVPDRQVTGVGLAIQQRRLEMNLSQEELAEAAGLHRTYVSLIERKSCNFSVKIFMRLAFVLDINPTELLELSESLIPKKKSK